MPKRRVGGGDHKSSVHPDIPNKPGKTNWVEQAGGLPKYIERVAKHIHHDSGYSVSRAIAAAVSQTRKRAAAGNREAQRAIAEWERMKRSGRKRGRSRPGSRNLSVSEEYRREAPTVRTRANPRAFPIADRRRLRAAIRLYNARKNKMTASERKRVRRHILSRARALGETVNLAVPGVTVRRPFDETKHRRGFGGKFAPKGLGPKSVAAKPKPGGVTAGQQIADLKVGESFDLPGVQGRITRTESGFVVTGPNGFREIASTQAEAMAVAARMIRRHLDKTGKQSTGTKTKVSKSG